MPTVPYVLPLPTPASGGPLAAWVGAWGIAATAPKLGFDVQIVSPQGTFDVESLQPVLAAEKKKLPGGKPPREHRTKRLVKDARQWVQQKRFARSAVETVQSLDQVPFVLTRHVLFGGAGAACASALGVPLVTWIHAALVQEATSWSSHRFAPALFERVGERRYLDRAQLRVAVTQNVLDDLGLHGPTNQALGNGTLLERFDGGGDRGRRVVWIGSFRGFHGLDRIVAAFDGIDGELVLVGRGSQRPKIEADVARRGLQERVELPGFVAPLALPEVLTGCSVGVVASGVDLDQFHYSPVKLREYAAAGLVVCVPAVGEMAALADEPWVVPHDNTEAGLRSAMDQALDLAEDPANGAAARAFAAEHYSWEPWWRGVLSALER